LELLLPGQQGARIPGGSGAAKDGGLNNCLKFFAKQKTFKPKNGRMPFLGSARDRSGIKTLCELRPCCVFIFDVWGTPEFRGQTAFLLERKARFPFFARSAKKGNAPK
jgi:hypothetical protein